MTLRKIHTYADVKMKKYMRKTNDTEYSKFFHMFYNGEISVRIPKEKPEFQKILDTVETIALRSAQSMVTKA